LDEAAGQAGPYGQVIGFPTFAVVFAIAPFGAAVTDPDLGVDLLKLVHGEQEFEFLEPMRPGDRMTTTGKIQETFTKAGMTFLVVTTESKNQHGKMAVRGTWTAVIRS
jgi:acyl dehydratase